jgi:hypothetical protein
MPKKTCVVSLCLSPLLFITSPSMIHYRCRMWNMLLSM